MELRIVWRSFTIGVICGLRSMTGPALARWRVRDPLRLGYAALAAGELIADKLPATPARTIPPALIFRIVSGAFTGRSVAAAFAGNRTVGILAGAVGAIVGSYGGQAVRTSVVRATGLPDPIYAIGEDLLAIYGAAAVTRA